MATTALVSIPCVVLDASLIIALCAKEPRRFDTAKAEVENHAQAGGLFYAPNVIVGETLYVLRRKLRDGDLTDIEHAQAVQSFYVRMTAVLPPPGGEVSLILRADAICTGLGPGRSADALYVALAEELSRTYETRLLTFDQGMSNEVARHAPDVTVHLLI